jgi:hypothetical protein
VTPKVFISSTAKDLHAYRQAAMEECVRIGLLPLDMKFFEAMAKGATEGSKQKLDEADLYLGIFAHRYGYVEEGYSASVTECEFDYATERGLDRLCFLVQDDHPVGEVLEDDATRERLRAFKQREDARALPTLRAVRRMTSVLPCTSAGVRVARLGDVRRQRRLRKTCPGVACFPVVQREPHLAPEVIDGREPRTNVLLRDSHRRKTGARS